MHLKLRAWQTPVLDLLTAPVTKGQDFLHTDGDQLAIVAQDKEAEGSTDEDEDARPAPDHLAGLKVRHKAEDLGEGETVVMTLADRSILDARGDLDEDGDELENVLAVRLCQTICASC